MFKSLRLSLAVVLGAAVVAWLAWVSFRTEPVLVDLHTVAVAPMQVTVNVDGETRIREIYEIAAPIDGFAQRSPVEVGDPVVKDETVVAIVEPVRPSLLDARSRLQANAALQEAEASLLVAQTDHARAIEERTHAQNNFQRVQTLVERGVSSLTQLEDADEQLDIAEAAVNASAARIRMAEGALASARAALIEPGSQDAAEGMSCCVPLLAPADGVVLDVDVISARPVAAGTRLATVGDPTDLEIIADLLSVDAVRLSPGARAIVERWGGAGVLSAELLRVQPSARTEVSALGIEEQRVDAIFALTTPAAERRTLGDGFSVFLRIVEWQDAAVLQVPLGATFRLGDRWGVFVVSDGVARQRVVDLGRRNTTTAQVLDGLEPGERVVTHPSDALADGSPVIERSAG